MSTLQEAEAQTYEVPLAALHRRLGASLASYRGAYAPSLYGDEAGEYAALREACGLIDRSWTVGIEMRGEDRARYLGGLVTCDVKGLQEGQGVYGFVTTLKGRVMSDLVVLALDERLWLEVPPGMGDVLAEHLGKYVIVDRVEIGPLAGVIPLSLVGPRSHEVVAEARELPEDDYSHREISLCGVEARLMREPMLDGVPGWTLWVPTGEAERLLTELTKSGSPARPVGHRALDRLRVEAGRPLCGVDFGDTNFPQETGLEEAVSYTKGCYLGQEVVARIHYRGGSQPSSAGSEVRR